MENFVVWIIVGASAAWGTFRLVRKRQNGACGTGCAGCHCASKPQKLVTLRR